MKYYSVLKRTNVRKGSLELRWSILSEVIFIEDNKEHIIYTSFSQIETEKKYFYFLKKLEEEGFNYEKIFSI